MKTVTKPKKVVKITKKSVKTAARNNNTGVSTILRRGKKQSVYGRTISTHVYKILDIIVGGRINSNTSECTIKLLNVDTDNTISRQGKFIDHKSSVIVIVSSLEGFHNIHIPEWIKYNMPCEIIRHDLGDGEFIMVNIEY